MSVSTHISKSNAAKKVVFALVLVVVCVTAPVAIVLHFQWQGAATVSICASMACIVAGMQAGWRVAFWYVVIGLSACTFLAALFPGNPWWGALILGAVAYFVGRSAARGLSSALLMLPIALGFQIAQPPEVTVGIAEPVFLGLLVLATSIFSTAVVYFVSRARPTPSNLTPINAVRASYFALALGPFVAIATWLVVDLNLGHAGAWMILTILVIFKPFIQDGIQKAISRTFGTIGGFVIAMVVAQLSSSEIVFYVVGAAAMITALAVMLLGRPYWQYAIALTTAIVMIEGATDLVRTAETRLAATLIGAAASLIVMLVLRPYVAKASGKHGLTHY
jgi:Fusaric acid resistance protein-like